MPTVLCQGGGTINLTGTNFEQGATVTIGPLQGLAAAVSNSMQASVNVGGGLSPQGSPYSLTLTNPSGCSVTAAQKITVQQGLTVFFADPPTVWNGINTQITVYGANVVGGLQKVSIVLNGSNNPPTPLVIVKAVGNKAIATVPINTPAGIYDIIVQDANCPAVLPKGLKVVQNTTFMITKISPTFGWTGAPTSVTINSNNAFLATPRAYLSPAGNNNTTATSLAGVAFVDGSTLTAVVPQGTQVGTYNLIVVNPDGGVGVLQNAFTEDASPVPVITDLDPGFVSSGNTFNVIGQNFANNVLITHRLHPGRHHTVQWPAVHRDEQLRRARVLLHRQSHEPR
jgi:hypothetical protein